MNKERDLHLISLMREILNQENIRMSYSLLNSSYQEYLENTSSEIPYSEDEFKLEKEKVSPYIIVDEVINKEYFETENYQNLINAQREYFDFINKNYDINDTTKKEVDFIFDNQISLLNDYDENIKYSDGYVTIASLRELFNRNRFSLYFHHYRKEWNLFVSNHIKFINHVK